MNELMSVPTEIVLDWISAGLYAVLVIIVWKAVRRSPNQLLWSIFAFGIGMGLFKLFEGTAEFLEIPFLLNFGLLGAMIGDAFTLRFPLQEISERWREKIFFTVLLLGIFIFFLLIAFPVPSERTNETTSTQQEEVAHEETEAVPHDENTLLHNENQTSEIHEDSEKTHAHVAPSQFTWLAELYLILISGVISGGYMIWRGIQSTAAWLRVKSIGSGVGLAGCCIAIERAALLFGAGLTTSVPLFAEVIGAIAPLIVIFAILYGRYLQNDIQKNIAEGALSN